MVSWMVEMGAAAAPKLALAHTGAGPTGVAGAGGTGDAAAAGGAGYGAEGP